MVSRLERRISQLWHCCSSSISQQMKDGVELEKGCYTVLGIHNVSAMKETQNVEANEKVKIFSLLPKWICVCPMDTQQWLRISQSFLFIPKSCFLMSQAINYSVDAHLSLFYCFEQLQYCFLLPPTTLQTQSQTCMHLHVHKRYIIFHSHSTIVRSLLNPILHRAFCMVSIL